MDDRRRPPARLFEAMKRCQYEDGQLAPCKELTAAMGKRKDSKTGIHVYHRQVRYKRGHAQMMPHVFNFCPFCGAELKWWDSGGTKDVSL